MIITQRKRLEALEEGMRTLEVRIVVTREADGTATVFVEDFCGWWEHHNHSDWEEAMAVWEAKLAGSVRRRERTAA